MRRILAIILALALCLSLCACNSTEKMAYELSKSAFSEIQEAYDIIKDIPLDILIAWGFADLYEDDIKDGEHGFDNLCSVVSLSRDEMLDGLAGIANTINDYGIDDIEYFKEEVREFYDLYFYSRVSEDGIVNKYGASAACIYVVSEAYQQNGDLPAAEALLNSAQDSILELSEKCPSYEHYSNLKEYFTAVNAYYNFCSNPGGSYNSASDKIDDYADTIEECYNKLYYFFDKEN